MSEENTYERTWENRHPAGRSWGLTLMSTVRETFNNQEGRTTDPVGISQLSPQTLVARMGARKRPNSSGSVSPRLL